MAVEYTYIGLADILENHITPPYSSPGSQWRYALLSLCRAYSQRGRAVSTVFDRRVLYTSLAVAPAPYGAIGSGIQPLRAWAIGYDVF